MSNIVRMNQRQTVLQRKQVTSRDVRKYDRECCRFLSFDDHKLSAVSMNDEIDFREDPE